MKEEKNARHLASFRVKRERGSSYRTMKMTEDEIAERRLYIRRALRDTPRNNLPNDTLVQIRLIELDNKCYLFEDPEGREFYIPSGKMSRNESDFRKVRSMVPFQFFGLSGKDFNWDIYQKDVRKAKSYVNN